MKKLALTLIILLLSTLSFSEGIPWDDFYNEANALDHGKMQTHSNAGKIITYLPGWNPPPAAGDISAAGYTHVIVAFGVFSTNTPGEIIAAFDTVTPSYVKSLQAAGIKVLVSIGGASTSVPNTSTDFHSVLITMPNSKDFIDKFVSSVETLMAQYGFDGVDFDIEQGLTGTGTFTNPMGDIEVLANIIQALHQKHSDMLISLAPQMANISATQGFDATWGNYAALIMKTAPYLTWVGVQLYNSGCCLGIDGVCYGLDAANPNANIDSYVAMATDLLENWPAKDKEGRATGFQPYISALDASQIVLGFPVQNNQGMSDGSPAASIPLVKRSITCLRTAALGPNSCNHYVAPKAYSNFGGIFTWDLSHDQSNGYNFSKSLKNCVMSQNCQ